LIEDTAEMGGEPGSIVALRRYYSDRLHEPTEADFLAELMEGNDRSAIITMCSLVDGAVESKLLQNLPALKTATESEINRALDHSGPLGTFSARINMLYYLGLIDKTLQNQLHDLRALRNAVAHTKRRVTFSDSPLQNVALRLFSPTGKFPLLEDTPHGYRVTLIAEGDLIYNSLAFGRDEAIQMVHDNFIKQGKTPPF